MTTKRGGKNNQLTSVASRRHMAVRVKTAKKRSNSSAQWLKRQLNDPYVLASKQDGYRSRAAYKLLQLDEQFNLLRPGQRVVDLGAAPGGWTQVVARVLGDGLMAGRGRLIGLDILEMDPIPGADLICMDFLAPDAPDALKNLLQGEADLVISDLAPSTTGHTNTDHLRIMAMVDAAALFAMEVLAPGGCFVCKVFQGGTENKLLNSLKKHFTKVRHAKPPASRAESPETYLVAQGFRRPV